MLAAVGVSLAGPVAGPGGRCLGAALALIAGAAAVVELGRFAEGERVDRRRIHQLQLMTG